MTKVGSSPGGARWLVPALLGILVQLHALPAAAQAPQAPQRLGEGIEETIDIFSRVTYTPPDAADYFRKDSDLAIRTSLMNLKKYHLGEEWFWRHYRAGRKDRALAELIFALRIFPNHPEALGLLAVMARESDDPGTAIPFFERAIRLYPQHAYTRAQYGDFLGSVGQVNPARMYLEEALRMDPTLDVARGWLMSLEKTTGSARSAPKAATSGGAGH